MKNPDEIKQLAYQRLEEAEINSLLFNGWDENARYKPCGYMLDKDVENLIELLSSENGILSWIEKN